MTTISEEQRVSEFIKKAGVTAQTKWLRRDPRDSGVQMDVWRVVLRRKDEGKRMQVMFRMGEGHNGGAPTPMDVLNSLLADAALQENNEATDMHEMVADDKGLEGAKRRHFIDKMERALERQTDSLQRFLDEDYEHLLWG